MNNLLSLVNNPFFAVLIGVLVGIYFIYLAWPKRNKLHKSNYRKAKHLLLKIQQVGLIKPAYVLGMLRKTNPFVFEELLLLAFKQQNYRVQFNFRYTGDGGIDGIVFDKHGHKYLIQAKRYKDTINPAHVDAFAKLIQQKMAAGGFFIHTGRTGKKSYTKCVSCIQIISGARLIHLLLRKPFLWEHS